MHVCAQYYGSSSMFVFSQALQKSTVFDALVGHIQNALDTPSLQAAALQLLRRVLLRNQVLTAAVYQCIEPRQPRPSFQKRGRAGRGGKNIWNFEEFWKVYEILSCMAHDNTAGATDEVGATMEVGRWARSDHMFIILKEFEGGKPHCMFFITYIYIYIYVQYVWCMYNVCILLLNGWRIIIHIFSCNVLSVGSPPEDTIGEIMITGSDKRTSQQCAQIFVDFMLDYPHEQKALQHRNSDPSWLLNLQMAVDRSDLDCLMRPFLAEMERSYSQTVPSMVLWR